MTIQATQPTWAVLATRKRKNLRALINCVKMQTSDKAAQNQIARRGTPLTLSFLKNAGVIPDCAIDQNMREQAKMAELTAEREAERITSFMKSSEPGSPISRNTSTNGPLSLLLTQPLGFRMASTVTARM